MHISSSYRLNHTRKASVIGWNEPVLQGSMYLTNWRHVGKCFLSRTLVACICWCGVAACGEVHQMRLWDWGVIKECFVNVGFSRASLEIHKSLRCESEMHLLIVWRNRHMRKELRLMICKFRLCLFVDRCKGAKDSRSLTLSLSTRRRLHRMHTA